MVCCVRQFIVPGFSQQLIEAAGKKYPVLERMHFRRIIFAHCLFAMLGKQHLNNWHFVFGGSECKELPSEKGCRDNHLLVIVALKAKRGDSKKGIITIYVSDTQSQNTLAAKHLQGIIEIIESMGGDVIIRECHERNFSCVLISEKWGWVTAKN